MSKPNPIGTALGLAAAVTFISFVSRRSWGDIKEGLNKLPKQILEVTGVVITATIVLVPLAVLKNILKP
jgi:hypothetical protein